MEYLSTDFLSVLFSIIIIDLVLAGDNAIVIGLAAKNLPQNKQKQVILWGTIGALIMRMICTFAVVWLLKIPGLLLTGGLILVWIACKLLFDENEPDHVKADDNAWTAIRTIVIADTVMGLDNVLAIAGAAHGHYLLVVMGLLISVPIIIWGSTLFLKLMERFPWIIYMGSGVLAWTAAKMIVDDHLVKSFFIENVWLKYAVIIGIISFVLLVGRLLKERKMNSD
ncbi:TerC family protein [Thermoflavimicrobium dichotomicum]|uniref:Integral membrane protein, YjbE family n=1 Tax=Thermoflavimicrobium dichotomicum TaxID=46223 RepID=A0A1I3JWJ0_9BACL|nr:TerC family protein [Thermoflavimicrobium dichotomicum]SFI64418.1 integral membrane protein, YjbE family [Thermoflavimicrobium dichotomicum]